MNTIQEKIQHFMDTFPEISKAEADFILDVVNWDGETKAAYKLAKKAFEEDLKKKPKIYIRRWV